MVETQRSSLSLAVWALVALLVLIGVYANYAYADVFSFPVRLAVGIVYFIILVLIASLTLQGKRFWTFFRDSRSELRKVVWPTRRETIQTTVLVIVVVLITSLVLWGIDSFLLWVVGFLTGQRG